MQISLSVLNAMDLDEAQIHPSTQKLWWTDKFLRKSLPLRKSVCCFFVFIEHFSKLAKLWRIHDYKELVALRILQPLFGFEFVVRPWVVQQPPVLAAQCFRKALQKSSKHWAFRFRCDLASYQRLAQLAMPSSFSFVRALKGQLFGALSDD
eukprot:1275372-Rhodomonas_salina.1